MFDCEHSDEESVGAVFYRCALQVNPAHYANTFQSKDHGLGEEEYIDKILEKCIECGIKVIAVTDHNHVGSVNGFQKKSTPLGITVFPGFEVETADGIHVLCLYPHTVSESDLMLYLGELGVTNTKRGDTTSCNKYFKELLECVNRQKGQTIAAHVTRDKGLLKTLEKQARIRAWKDSKLLCIQIPTSIDELDSDYKDIVKNTNPDYKRAPGAAENLAIAVVNASDVSKPEDLDSSSSTCLIKMDTPSLEGLRQAFLDPFSRIRLNNSEIEQTHVEFKKISWKGGFLDGCEFNFNKNLNTLIGGRGTGKSTIIESLRSVLNLKPLTPDAAQMHNNIVKHVLREGTQITLLVQVHTPTKRQYWVQQNIPNKPNIMDESNTILKQTPNDILPNIQIFGQHELSELTKHPSTLTDLLMQFTNIDSTSEIKREKIKLKLSLEESRKNIIQFKSESKRLKENILSLSKCQEKLDSFDRVELESKYNEKIQLIKEKQIFETTSKNFTAFKNFILNMKEFIIEDEYLKTFHTPDNQTAKLILELIHILENINQAIASSVENLDIVKNSVFEKYSKLKNIWQNKADAIENSFSKALRELHQKERDFSDNKKFIKLKETIELLRPTLDEKKTIDKKLSAEQDKRNALIVAWNKIKAGEFREFSSAANTVSKKLKNSIRVSVKYSSASENLSELFKDNLGGRLKEIFEILDKRETFSLSDFANEGRAGVKNLMNVYNFTEYQANHLEKAGDTFWMLVEESEESTTTVIELNVSFTTNEVSWKKINNLSTGQKATALLLLLLHGSNVPLVIDQPEDDLDNRFITDTIVSRIREKKINRQMIFSTHNANIPVLGDAELILGMPSNTENINKHVTIGAIDSSAVQNMVKDVLEGGQRAFELRRKKYGF